MTCTLQCWKALVNTFSFFFYLTFSLYGIEQYVFSLQAYFGPSTSEMALLLETKKTAGTSDSEEAFFLYRQRSSDCGSQ